jgi:acetyl-CoA decarbonylase/synthase complex subunit gamma
MPLTGLDIYKLLPKTNCGKCQVPTCLAFAMALAAKKISLDKCPYVSAEAKAALESASAPPIQLVTIGAGEYKIEIGNETVLFRHEQTFYHPPGLAVEIADSLSVPEIEKKAQAITRLVYDRVGKKVKVELIAVVDKSHDPSQFAQAVKTVMAHSPRALILVSFNPAILEAGVKLCADKRPLLYGANAENYQSLTELAKKYNCPLGVTGKNLDELAELTPQITARGVKELVINSGSTELSQLLSDITQMRRLALKKTFRPLGFPVIVFAPQEAYQSVLFGTTFIAKYGGLIVLPEISLWQGLVLTTIRQNIYTDPQKPIQVEPKLYSIGETNEQSPVLVTTNFSLTYFTVSPEVEASKVPSYMLVVNTEGMSVLTAFAADKLNEKVITKALNDYDVENKAKHHKVIIPGYAAVLSGKLEAESGWQVMVGPREASAIPGYLKNVWNNQR